MFSSSAPLAVKTICAHCGDSCEDEILHYHGETFCCQGCQTIFELFTENGLQEYYNLNKAPGVSPKLTTARFDYLENEKLVHQLVDYKDDEHLRITLEIPSIHCSSCIWLLEHLDVLDQGVKYCHVNFGKRELSLLLDLEQTTLRKNVELLSHIGYEPAIRLEKLGKKSKRTDFTKWYKIGVAGFCFGNIMLLTLPEYFDPSLAENTQYSVFFRIMNIALTLPVLLYVSPEYFISALKSIRAKSLNIDVPIALGLAVIFLRSLFEIITDIGPGYLDSFCGLMFFMSIGRTFQQITYDGLNFERDYKSYFPVSVAVMDGDEENYVPVTQLKPGEIIRLRHGEICPADAVLESETGSFDASFVTGEAKPVQKTKGQTVFAGLKSMGSATLLQVKKEVSQSYLTDLWNNKQYQKSEGKIQGMTDRLSTYFTPILLAVSIITLLVYGIVGNWSTGWNAFTAVLIVACPCALALASPFAMGNALRILGRNHFFVKNGIAIETLASVDHIVFDKTGTITEMGKDDIEWSGVALSDEQLMMMASLLKQSGHPLSRSLFKCINQKDVFPLSTFLEKEGKGLCAVIQNNYIKIGSADWCDVNHAEKKNGITSVWIKINAEVLGVFTFHNHYRKDLKTTLSRFVRMSFSILSGDNSGEQNRLKQFFPTFTRYRFQALPDEKPQYVNELKKQGYKVAMIGDGLNDSAALSAADIGISISDNLNTFSPASDAILDAKYFNRLPDYISFSKRTKKVIVAGFIISFLYNSVGLYFAITGNLSPVLAAILMPMSSITVVIFTTLTLNLIAKRMQFE